MRDLKVAYEILSNVYLNKAFASIELSKKINQAENKNFLTSLVYGVLEKNIELDYYIDYLVPKKPKNVAIIVLKIGMYIIKYMDSVPNYAAVNSTVDLCKEINKKEISGFINAVLKKFAQSTIELPKDKIKALSVKFSTPEFIIKEYIKEYGEEKTKAMLLPSNFTYEHFRVNKTYSIDKLKQELDKNNIKYVDSIDGAIFAKNDKTMHDLYSVGKVTVQSKTSMLTCKELDPKDNDLILDVCAAPGGKSVYISELANCKVVSCDIHPHRVELIQSYINRMQSKNVEPKLNDATKENPEFVNKFDKVLCDVPCSGLGVAKKKPDIYLELTKENISKLPLIQYRILDTSKAYVKKDGVLVYSTCTTLPQENRLVVEKFLKNNENFELIKEEQFLQDTNGLDGFYIAKLRRK